jgi:antitoxin component YwqK of YwqJK toxin-antitoxin module
MELFYLNKMKQILIFLYMFSSLSAISQGKMADTMYLKVRDLNFCFGQLESLTKSGGKYYCNRIEIDSMKYNKLNIFVKSTCDSLFSEVAVGKYCKFYNNDSVVVIEGTWFPEFYIGPYKEYYDSGKIKMKGEYSVKEGEYGEKKGNWIYYKKNGKIKKTINYS